MRGKPTTLPVLVDRTCETCGGAFVAQRHEVQRGYGRFCNRTCWGLSRSVNHPTARCEACGSSITLLPHLSRRGSRQRFCGRTCYLAAARTPLLDRFWPRVNKTETCWLWTGQTAGNGYGSLSEGGRRGRLIYAHRLAWELASGAPIPRGKQVLHTCDTPPCARNDEAGTYAVGGVTLPRFGHLFLGTHRDNVRDMHAKGRAPQPM